MASVSMNQSDSYIYAKSQISLFKLRREFMRFFLIYISGLDDKNCWSVDYVSRRICALQGLSVMIASIYSHPDNQPPKSKLWYKISGKEEDGELIEAAGRVEYRDHVKNRHVLIIRNLKKNDSAEYRFSLQRGGKQKKADLPGVTLVVTGTSSDYYIFNKRTCCMFSTYSPSNTGARLVKTVDYVPDYILDFVESPRWSLDNNSQPRNSPIHFCFYTDIKNKINMIR